MEITGRMWLVLPMLVLQIHNTACRKSAQGEESLKQVSRVSTSSPRNDKAMVRLKTFTYVDKEGIGVEAFRMLIPSDWKFEGGLRWILDNPGMPLAYKECSQSPNGDSKQFHERGVVTR